MGLYRIIQVAATATRKAYKRRILTAGAAKKQAARVVARAGSIKTSFKPKRTTASQRASYFQQPKLRKSRKTGKTRASVPGGQIFNGTEEGGFYSPPRQFKFTRGAAKRATSAFRPVRNRRKRK